MTIKTMADSHKCNDLGCKRQKYGGLNILCGACLMPCSLECISPRSEVVHLLQHLNIESCDEDESDQDKINNNNKKVKLLFGVDSVFEFICPSCREGPSIYDSMQNFI